MRSEREWKCGSSDSRGGTMAATHGVSAGDDDLAVERVKGVCERGVCMGVVVDRAAIGVRLLEDAEALDIPPQGEERITNVLGGRKTEIGAVGRIIDEDEQAAAGSAIFEPGMVTAIDLHERADGCTTRTLRAVACPVRSGEPHVGGNQPAPQGLDPENELQRFDKGFCK